MTSRLIRLGITGALTALALSAVAAPAQAVTCGPVLESVKICAGDDGRPYPVKVDKTAVGAAPRIGGALMVGNTLTVFDGAWEPRDAKLTHQWLRNDVPVLGATGSMYRLTSKDLGKGIRVATTVTAPDYLTRTVTSAKTGPVTNVGGAIPTVTPSNSVSIVWAGTDENEPSTLRSASAGIWPTPGIKFHYQWLRDGVPIPGANTIRFDTAGWGAPAELSVRVTGFAPGFDPVTLTSASQRVTAYDPIPGAVVTGGTGLGDVLTGDDSAPWSDPHGRDELSPEHRYQWLRNGFTIPGATGLTYTITGDDQGTTLVLHTITDTFEAHSKPIVIPTSTDLKALENVTNPVMTGDAVTGNPMTVTAGTWSLPTEKLGHTYTWFTADGKVVAYGPSFAPGKDHVGSKLNVLVTASAPGYKTAWVRLVAATPVTAPDPTQTKAPTITAHPVVGKSISVSGGTWSDRDPDVKRAFQWRRDGNSIAGATGRAYTPVGADSGRKLSVKVTSALDGRILKTQTIAAPARVAGGTLMTGTPTLSGTAKVRKVLTAKPGIWNKGTVFKYRWLRNGSLIPNAYSSTYRVRTADKDSRITVRITGSLLGYTTASRDSNAFIAR